MRFDIAGSSKDAIFDSHKKVFAARITWGEVKFLPSMRPAINAVTTK
jgi:hypothetical protein